MKAILICPAVRENVAALAEPAPLGTLAVLGRSLVERWLEHLACLGAKEVLLLASDRPEQIRALVGDGTRWGLTVKIFPEQLELTPVEARVKYFTGDDGNWLPAPNDVVTMDHLPGCPEFPTFTNYADWFQALFVWVPRAATAPSSLGIREIKPGVWVGMRVRVGRNVEFHAPCWIGENVSIAAGAVVGPRAILENRSMVEGGARIVDSVVGADTFVGGGLEVRNSIVAGNTLINWGLDSSIHVTDKFLLCSLDRYAPEIKPLKLFGRMLAGLTLAATLPVVLPWLLKPKLRGRIALRARLAVRPRRIGQAPVTGDTLVYYELTNAPGSLRRWPQLWSILCGDFAWIGNPPLNPRQAARLSNDFERLWLTVAPGIVSLADVEGCSRGLHAEACAHASYYAVRRSLLQDLAIFARGLFRFMVGAPFSRVRGRLIQTRRSRSELHRTVST